MNLYYQPGISHGVTHLDADESKHCVRVLRKKSGDTVTVTDGLGFYYDVVITQADARQCHFEIQKKTAERKRPFSIHIAISPTKNPDRIEWFVEKATELGIDKITLINCANTERSHIKTERLRKIAISAMKQSLKATLPAISEGLLSFGEVVTTRDEEHRCIAHVDDTNPLHLRDAVARGTSCCVLIGPEGDFSPDELQSASRHNFRKVSLGPSRLRTETAGVAACCVLNVVNQ